MLILVTAAGKDIDVLRKNHRSKRNKAEGAFRKAVSLISPINYSFITYRLLLDTFDSALVPSEAALALLEVLMRDIVRCSAICYPAERASTENWGPVT